MRPALSRREAGAHQRQVLAPRKWLITEYPARRPHHAALAALEKLDVLNTIVSWARHSQATSPGLGDSIDLRQARHPLLALQLAGSR